MDERLKDQTVAISVIVCTRNRAGALRMCLAALDLPAVKKVRGEVILVDNGSTDATHEVIEHFRARAIDVPVTPLHVEEPGLSRARNAGIREARGQMLVFLDDDCYLGSGYFDAVKRVLGKDNLGYCGGRILPYDPADADYGYRRSEEMRLIKPYSFVYPGIIQGANMVVRRAVFERVGYFDEDMGAGAKFRCEDIDIIARASLAGFTGAYLPNLVVYHHHRRKPGKDIGRLAASNDYARGAFYAKFILGGHMHYLDGWWRRTFRWRKPKRTLKRLPVFLREVYGALDYVSYHIRHGNTTRNVSS
jgi:GT2 family glycosyltransferase